MATLFLRAGLRSAISKGILEKRMVAAIGTATNSTTESKKFAEPAQNYQVRPVCFFLIKLSLVSFFKNKIIFRDVSYIFNLSQDLAMFTCVMFTSILRMDPFVPPRVTRVTHQSLETALRRPFVAKKSEVERPFFVPTGNPQ